jgi:hypothetical protein
MSSVRHLNLGIPSFTLALYKCTKWLAQPHFGDHSYCLTQTHLPGPRGHYDITGLSRFDTHSLGYRHTWVPHNRHTSRLAYSNYWHARCFTVTNSYTCNLADSASKVQNPGPTSFPRLPQSHQALASRVARCKQPYEMHDSNRASSVVAAPTHSATNTSSVSRLVSPEKFDFLTMAHHRLNFHSG